MENDIDIVKFQVWDEFYTQMERRYPVRGRGSGPDDCRYNRAMENLARFCIDEQLDPREYVQTVLPRLERDGPLITPNDLVGLGARNLYFDICEDRTGGTEAENMWVHQKRKLDTLVSRMYSSEQEALLCGTNVLAPWFRIMYSDGMDEKLFDIFAGAAWKNLNENKPLLEFVRGERPSQVKLLEDYTGRELNGRL